MVDPAEKLASGTLTPMMRQYFSVKVEHPEAIVLFRMGDFFETFYDDAETCARLLDITLTKRSKEKDAPPMAGVPHHAIDGYIARLIDLGRTVVLADQVEDPKKAKGLVRRAVTRVLSPGTFVDANAAARTPVYLAALTLPKVRARTRRNSSPVDWGLAALDLATGEFRATAGAGDEALIDELGRLGTREVVVSDRFRGESVLERAAKELPRLVVTYAAQEEVEGDAPQRALADTIGPEEVAATEKILPSEAIASAGLAIWYVEQTQLRAESFERKAGGTLGHVDTLKPYLPGDALIIDTEARTHLELFGNSADGGSHGALIGIVDRAVTAMGGRLLARWLARPLVDSEEIERRLDAVDALVRAPTVVDDVREALRKVHDLERLLGRVVMGRATPRDVGALRASLERLPVVLQDAAKAATAFSTSRGPALDLGESGPAPSLLDEIGRVDPCDDVRAAIAGALVEAPPTDFGSQRVFREGYHEELDRLTALAKSSKEILAELERRERERTGITSLKVKYNRVFGYFIEVTKANLDAVPAEYIRKQTTVNSERYYTEELKDLEEQILTADDKRVALEEELFGELIRRVAAEARRLRNVAQAVAAVDALAGLAHVAETGRWVRPEVDDGPALEIADGRHPVLDALADELGERFVPNDLSIGQPERLLIITGPNMAGKSTIMRQTALIVLLAQMGSFVPARAARIGVIDRIFTRVGASDELSRGRSTFMVEMTETARILRSATDRSLVLLDEIGRGTSTFDGLSIAWAVAEHLHDTIGAKTLFATHYHELTELCRDKERAANHHVAVKEWNEEIVFLRKLLPGPTNRSYGVQVARLAGLPRTVVVRAKQVLESLEAQDLSAGNGSAVAHKTGTRAGPQLHLFAAGPAPSPVESDVLDAIRSICVDDVTPRAALDLIAEWQEALRQP